jgi:hypothetical protein
LVILTEDEDTVITIPIEVEPDKFKATSLRSWIDLIKSTGRRIIEELKSLKPNINFAEIKEKIRNIGK